MRRIPDFTRPEWHRSHDDDHLEQSIREGKGMMPARKDQLSPRDIGLLVSLVRDFRGGGQVLPVEFEGRDEASRQIEPEKSAELGEITTRSAPASTRGFSPAASEVIPGLFQQFCASCHGTDGRGNAMRHPTSTNPGLHLDDLAEGEE